ncbi:MAG: hypothetical protein Kow0010_11570 [Dehalococcoidia bacterium]
MEIHGEHRFASPRSLVWQLLLDPAALRRAIPGCERFEEAAPGRYDVAVRIGIAAIKGRYAGTVRVVDEEPEHSYGLVFDGAGKPGTARATATVTLEDDAAGGTIVRYRGDVAAGGGIARLGGRVLASAARLLIGQFFRAMDEQVRQRTA